MLVQGCPRFSSDSKDFPRFYKYFVLIAALCMFLESLSLMFTLCKKTLQIHGITWMLHLFAYVLSFGSIVWTFYQIDNTNLYHIDLCIECMPKNCSIPDLQDYPFSNDLNNMFKNFIPCPVFSLVLDSPNVCYGFILFGCICSCLPTFASIHQKVKERQQRTAANQFDSVSNWLKSKDYVEMDDYPTDEKY